MSESSSVVKRTVRRTVIGGGGGDDLDGVTLHKYQIFRGMSPTTSNRLELRIKELEDALEQERQVRVNLELEINEYSGEFESMRERLEEYESNASGAGEANRRRDAENAKLKKDIELLTAQYEASEASMRKRHQEALNELASQLEALGKQKNKHDKEKQTFIIEIDSLNTALDGSNKARIQAESKLENLEDQLRRARMQIDELTRQNGDLNNWKARLSQENLDLQRQVQELDTSNATLAKAKSILTAQLEDLKSRLDEETREKNQLAITVTNLQVDLDNLNARLEEETEAGVALRAQLQRAQADYQALKNKYDKDITARVEEYEEQRRKMAARISELENDLEQWRNKAGKYEKDKIKLQVDLRDLGMELDARSIELENTTKKLRSVEGSQGDMTRRIDELTVELANATGENQRIQAELARLRAALNDLQDKHDALLRENKQLSEGFRDAQSQNKDLSRQVAELLSIRAALEGERDRLAVELADATDALRDAQARLDAANASLAQLKSDFELRLRQKDEEMEVIRKNGLRSVDELQRTVTEIETKYKSELSRYKKKYDTDLRELEIQVDTLSRSNAELSKANKSLAQRVKKYDTDLRELEIQVDTLSRSNAELSKANKSLAQRVKELEVALEEERRSGDDAKNSLTLSERKRIALQTELEDVRALLEAAERARKNAEGAAGESSSRLNELTISVTSLTNDRRRLEQDLAVLQADNEEAHRARKAAEERADRLQLEVNRLIDELRREQENYKNAEALRKSLEVEIREITLRLEEAEAFAQREGKRLVAKLQARVHDLEAELDAEQRRGRDLIAENRRLQKALQELRVQYEEEHRLVIELTDQVNNYVAKINLLKRQLLEAEEVIQITMNKYRKAQQMLEDAERRVTSAEKNISINVTRRHIGGGGGSRARSMSVSRETRVVRV